MMIRWILWSSTLFLYRFALEVPFEIGFNVHREVYNDSECISNIQWF